MSVQDGCEKVSNEYAAFVGIDWADQEHQLCLVQPGSSRKEMRKLAQKPFAIVDWVSGLRERFGNRPVAVAIEQSRGALVYALQQFDFLTIYPINPVSLARYRKALTTSLAKDDPRDAEMLVDLLMNHRDRLRPWQADTPQVRLLRLLTEHRRRAVNERTRFSNRLKAALKMYFPQALEWVGEELFRPLAVDFLSKWPTLSHVQKARPDTLRRFYYAHNVRRGDLIEQRIEQIRQAQPLNSDPVIIEAYRLRMQGVLVEIKALNPTIRAYERRIAELFAAQPDATLFKHLPGAGPNLSPRLLAVFGTNRELYESARALQQFSGIAPVTVQSGKTHRVHRRWACPKFVLQTFHEFANLSLRESVWAKAYYENRRQNGATHHVAVRALAFKWIRILYRCWQDRRPYDELAYLKALQRTDSYLFARTAKEAAV